MFNFFDEIKKTVKNFEPQELTSYNIVNISGKILYVEGHLGLTELGKERISFKVKKGRVTVEGENLCLAELADSTMKIVGDIKKFEVL